MSVATIRPAGRVLDGAAWSLAGNVCYAASQWAMLVLIARLGNPAMLGAFALGLALVTPVTMFANLQLRGVLATDARGRFGFGDYLGLRVLTTALALLVLAGLALTGSQPLVVGAIAAAKAAECLGDVCQGLLQQHDRLDLIARSQMLKGAGSLAALAIGLAHGLAWALLGWALVSAAVAWGYDARQARRFAGLRPRFTRRLAELGLLALPLGVVFLFTSLTTSLPRYFIAHALGPAALGVFSALAYMTVAGGTVVGALGQAASPQLARLHAAGDFAAFRGRLAKLLAAGAGLGLLGVLGALLLGRPLLALVYGPAYAAEAGVLVLLMLASIPGYLGSLLGFGLTAAGIFRLQAPLFGAVMLATLAASALLIPAHGLAGAAIALGLGWTLQCVGAALLLARRL